MRLHRKNGASATTQETSSIMLYSVYLDGNVNSPAAPTITAHGSGFGAGAIYLCCLFMCFLKIKTERTDKKNIYKYSSINLCIVLLVSNRTKPESKFVVPCGRLVIWAAHRPPTTAAHRAVLGAGTAYLCIPCVCRGGVDAVCMTVRNDKGASTHPCLPELHRGRALYWETFMWRQKNKLMQQKM